MQPEIWGDFEVHPDQLLGRGGAGSAYRGRWISADREVAVKVLKKDLSDDYDFAKRFNAEAPTIASLEHPNIARVYTAGEHQGLYFFAQELLDGEDLGAYLRREHKFSREEILRVATDAAAALGAASQSNILHRDLKPSNLFLTRDDQLKLMDFGLAGGNIGGSSSLRYASPEQARLQALDVRSDLYSLGAVLYELATGFPPFTGDDGEALVDRIEREDPPPPRSRNPELDPQIEAFILRLLAKKPGDRFQTPEELAQHCRAVLEGTAPPPSAPPKAPQGVFDREKLDAVASPTRDETVLVPSEPPPKKSHTVAFVFLLLVGIGVVGAAGWFGWKRLQQVGDSGPTAKPAKTKKPEDPSRKDPTNGDGKNGVKPDPAAEGKAALARADEAMKRGDWDAAGREIEEAERKLPEDDPARAEIKAKRKRIRGERALAAGESAMAAKDWAGAAKAYEEALDALPQEDERRAQIEKKLKEAREKKAEPEAVQVYLTRAEDALVREDWDAALRELAEAEKRLPRGDPRLAKVKEMRASARKGISDRAVKAGDDAAAAKDWAGAAKAYEEALQALPEDDPGRAAVEKKLAEVRKKLVDPEGAGASIARAEEAMKRGDWDAALREWEEAERKLPEGDPRLADVRAKKAQARCERALKAGDAAAKKKDWGAAVRAYEEALRALAEGDPRTAEVQAKLTSAFYNRAVKAGDDAAAAGDWNTAVRSYDEAIQALPEGDSRLADAEARRTTARYRRALKAGDDAMKAKDWAAAARSFEEAAKELPEGDTRLAEARKRLDEARFQSAYEQGREKLARKEWEAAIRPLEEALGFLAADDPRRAKVTSEIAQARFEVASARGDEAFERKDWAAAKKAYAEAIELLPESDPRRTEMRQRLDRAELETALEEAEKEPDLAKRVALYLSVRSKGLARVRPLLRAAAFDLAKERTSRKEWGAAAEALQVAIENEPDAMERSRLERRKKVCERVQEALDLEKQEKWAAAKEIWVDLLGGETFEWRVYLQERLKAVNEKLDTGMTGDDLKAREAFQRLTAEAKRSFENGDWAGAHRKMDEAADETYKRFHDAQFGRDRAHYRTAANPPKGTVYVPGGRYTIGDTGDRGINGPAWEADLKPYLIDVREVAKSEYREFLRGLETQGHKLCHRDEPRGLTHLPERRSPGEGPVNWVNWWDAYAYAAWKGRRLPTEMEFEVAAGYDPSSRSRRTYPWGDAYGDGRGESAFGLRGLDNDVLEWTESEYQPYPNSKYTDDKCGPERRILRGGARTAGEQRKNLLKTTYRTYWPRARGEMYTGFRCAQDIPEK
ncbi:MAG: SUMF1/EgtB/PvdO family nonheme iron enzyme [Planctomycetes bacterium]|nr:SUMF1/EgtB/PvdO family nonheme iron enzyme [Planctomycetota bacterium]